MKILLAIGTLQRNKKAVSCKNKNKVLYMKACLLMLFEKLEFWQFCVIVAVYFMSTSALFLHESLLTLIYRTSHIYIIK